MREKYEPNPVLVRALDVIFTSARRPRAERLDLDRPPGRFFGANPFACILRRHRLPVGPVARRRQRGLPEHARRNRDVSRVAEFIARAKDKTDPFKLMGFGHRVYKNFDPAPSSCARSATKC